MSSARRNELQREGATRILLEATLPLLHVHFSRKQKGLSIFFFFIKEPLVLLLYLISILSSKVTHTGCIAVIGVARGLSDDLEITLLLEERTRETEREKRPDETQQLVKHFSS